MDDRLDRLADKLAGLDREVSTKLRIKEVLDEMVRRGKLTYDPETGEYTRLFEDPVDEPEA
jgi:polyhydroxyalkanoate synthesis regulator phasin